MPAKKATLFQVTMDQAKHIDSGKKLTREEALARLHVATTPEEVLAVVKNYGGLPVGPAPGWEKFIPLPSLWGQT